MLDILNEMFPENIANRIFTFVFHPIADLVNCDLIYSEILKYPSYIIDFKSFSSYYVLIFNILTRMLKRNLHLVS